MPKVWFNVKWLSSRRRLLAAACVAGAAVGSLLAVPGTANAYPGNCSSGYGCIWEDIHYVTNGNSLGTIRFFLYIPHYAHYTYAGTSINGQDTASSVYNNGTGGERVYWFKDSRCTGTSFSAAAQTGDSDLTNGSPPGNLNDELSSGAFASQIASCNAAA